MMDISIVLKDGSYAAHGDVDAIILLENNSWVMQEGKPRVTSPFRIQISDHGDCIDFNGFMMTEEGYEENLGFLEMPKRQPRY